MPKFSIITVNLNNLEGLKKTMQSVLEQTFTDYEYIIIDGGSKDGSKEYIEEHSEDVAYWISEKDGGIYQGMNKGIKRAQGEYLLFLNSGDVLIKNNTLELAVPEIKEYDIIYGDFVYYINGIKKIRRAPEKLKFSFFLKDTLPHQATFIKRKLFDRTGVYDERFKSTSDWFYFINSICKFNASYKRLIQEICIFDMNGISSNLENWEWIKKDKKFILNENFSSFIADYKEMDKLEKEVSELNRKYSLIYNSKWWKLRNILFKIFKSN